MIAGLSAWRRLAWILGLLVAAGCSRARPVEPNQTESAACSRSATPTATPLRDCGTLPKISRSFSPIWARARTEDLLRSPNDGEKFVVIWGVNFDRLPRTQGGSPYVVAVYEQKGVGGKRYVLRFPLSTCRMTDEQWKTASFPPGYTPPP